VWAEICEAIVPGNTIADIGGKAVLNCRQSSQNILWTFCPRNGAPYAIASNCAIVPSEVGRYRVDKANYGCNLVIDNVTASHLGTYTCQDLTLSDHGHSAELGNTNENLALNRNTVQSTTYNNDFLPNNAVDGKPSCAATLNGYKQWWAVDLGQETSVGRVRITTRSDVANTMYNFFIGLTNVSPYVTKPDLTKSSVCKFFSGYPPAETPTDILCERNTKPGRYLFIQQTLTNLLIICEVEVYYE
jgi:hypothetical protein